MIPRTYYLETFGCQMNVLDSELVAGQMRALGLERVQSPRNADVVLFNTCSVRQHAEDKVLSRLGHLKAQKRRRPEMVVGVIGCMAERYQDELFVAHPHLDLMCGPGELPELPGLLQAAWQKQTRLTALAGSQSRRTEVLQRALEYDSLEALDLSRAPDVTDSVLQSYVRVQRGCDKFCTYCVVPFTRGPERSRPPEHIVEEARRLAAAGCREVTLLGQTVNSYVHQEGGRRVGFAELLERVHAVPGLDRVRFVTSYPADWDEDIFRVMRDCPRVCPYLHIPAQSGSDRILKRMRRGYTAGTYLRLLDTARQYLPDIALAGDFIVGFCDETEEDFAATVDLVRRVQYKSLFVFKYSPRPGTAAHRHQEDNVPMSVKARRNNELLAVQAEIGLRQKQALVGHAVEVLVEGHSKLARRAQRAAVEEITHPSSEQDRGSEVDLSGRPAQAAGGNGNGAAGEIHQLVGRTPQDLIVVFDGADNLVGGLVRIRIDSVTPLTLFGRLEGVISPRQAVKATALPLAGS